MNFLELAPDPSSIPLPFPSPQREDTSDDNNETEIATRLERVKFPNAELKVNHRQQSESLAEVHEKPRRKRKKKQGVSPTQNGDSSRLRNLRKPLTIPSTAKVQQQNVIVINPPLNCILSPPITVERRNTASRKGKEGLSIAAAAKSAHRVEHTASPDGVQKAEQTLEKPETGEGKKKRKRKKRSKVSPKEDVASVHERHPSPIPCPAAVELSSGGKNAKGLSRKLRNRSLAAKKVPSQKPQPRPFFKPHIAPDSVEHGIGKGVLVRGQLRVNARDPGQCWVVDSSGTDQSDYLILGAKDRNRALHGDTVILRVKPREQWVLRDNVYQGWKEDNAEITDGGGCSSVDVDKEVNVVEESSTVIELEEEIVEEKEKEAMTAVENEEASLEENLERRLVYSRDLLVTILSKISPTDKLGNKLQKDSPPSTSDVGRRVRSVRHSNFHTLRFIAEKESVPDELLHRTAEVVFIEQRSGARGRAVGLLKPAEKGHAIFVPNDTKTPLMNIPPSQLPAGFRKRPQDFASFLFAAEFDDEWPSDCNMAAGRLLRQLGCAGDLEAETEGLLMANNIDYREFPEELLESLPACATSNGGEWRISETEMANRKDFRDLTVFTIDPSTARDLDDALHIRPTTTTLGAEAWEVGVHIADVSHFVHEGTQLDEWAAGRATSVYIVDRVIPMLPRPLCENLCSLNPGEDKLTFSVVWTMDRKGRILDEWFGRSVIRSCAKLAYDHAEEIIKGADEWLPSREEGLPVQIFNSKAPSDVRESVLRLNYLAKKLRERRFADGALKLDQPKLKFKLDADTGAPYGLALDERGEANFLVEEFMLLANMAVAKKIYGAFPEVALLRRHPPPNTRTLLEMVEKSSALNYPISGSTSFELNSSLQTYGAQPELQSTVMPFLHKLVMRSMRLAKYFCPGFYKDRRMDEEEERRDIDRGKEERFRHYALSCDLYTHFTSPIRRYPDVIVHRLLAATLDYCPAPSTNAKEMEKIAERCNEAKSAARVVSDGSAEFFFDELIKVVGKLDASGVVVGVFQNAFDVLLTEYGLTRRVYLSKLPSLVDAQFRKGRVFNSLLLTFTAQPEGEENEVNFKKTSIEVLAIVKVVLTPSNSKSPLGVRHIATILP